MEPPIRTDRIIIQADAVALVPDNLTTTIGDGTTPPLRLQVLSGLHLDELPDLSLRLADGVDAVVVAGDTSRNAERTFTYLREAFPHPIPVLTILGGELSSGCATAGELRRARAASYRHRIALLEDRTFFFKGVRFVGASSWPASASDILDMRGSSTSAIEVDGTHSDRNGASRTEVCPSPQHPSSLEASTTYVDRILAQGWSGPTVVVTQQMPSTRQAASGRHPSRADADFADGSGTVVEGSGAALWIYGQARGFRDYRLGRTRVVCNPRGRGLVAPSFDPELVVEVPR